MSEPYRINIDRTGEIEQFVLGQLELNESMNRFELMAIRWSPLIRKTSYHVLKAMEDKGLIVSRLETNRSAHRWYRVA